MHYPDFQTFLATGAATFAKGPVGIILVEDKIEVESTIRHHLDAGFKALAVFGAAEFDLAALSTDKVAVIDHNVLGDQGPATVVNGCIAAAPPATWMFYCYNAEFLFFPFCEHRSVGEMLAFHTEERRDSVLTYVVDLYAGDLINHPSAVSIDDAHLDKSGYYALARLDRENCPRERQLDFFGGLRWRFEEHIPAARRRIDRISLFKTKPELKLTNDHLFNDQEYNTYSCPWHHNITASLCSFRTAKALKRNPGSTYDIKTFKWRNSAQFKWHSQQLLDLGLMEPGQWF